MAIGVLELALTGLGRDSVFREALGGPTVVVVDGQVHVSPGWNWLFVCLLYLASTAGAIDNAPGWTRLTIARGVSRRAWAGARLAALAIGALLYLAALLGALGVHVILGPPRPFIRAGLLWDVGLWALGLISVSWFAFALALITRQVWPAFVVTALFLGISRFGGPLSPYLPFAQWMAALHGLPGTLSVQAGVAYVTAWAMLCAAAVLWAAAARWDDLD